MYLVVFKLKITVLWCPMPRVAVELYTFTSHWYYILEDMMVTMTMNIT